MIVRDLTCSTEYSVQYRLETLAAFLQSVEIVRLAERGALHCVERQTLQSDVAH